MRIEIVHNHVQLALGIGRYHFVHEGQKIPALTAVEMSRLHLPTGHFQGGEEGGSAMPLVLVAKAGESLAVGQSQPALRALQSLNMRLLIHAQDHGVFRRVQVKPHDIGRLACKLRVGGNAPRTPALQANVVPPQGRPDPIRRYPQGLSQQPAIPGSIAPRRRAVQLCQQTFFRVRPVLDRLPRTQGVGQSRTARLGKASAPLTYSCQAAVQLIPDGVVAHPLGSQKDNLGSLCQRSRGLMAAAPTFQL